MLHSSLLPFHPCWLESSEEKGGPAEQFQDDSGSTQSPAAARLSSGEQFLGNALASTGSCPLQAGRAPAQFPAFRRGLEHRRDAGRADSRGFPCKGPLSPSFPLCSSPLEKERPAGCWEEPGD